MKGSRLFASDERSVLDRGTEDRLEGPKLRAVQSRQTAPVERRKPAPPPHPAPALSGPASVKQPPPAATTPANQPHYADDDKLRMVSEKLADIYYASLKPFSDDTSLAKAALSHLKNPITPLDPQRFRRVLFHLSHHKEAYLYLFKLTRDEDLSARFVELGVDWNEMFAMDPPTPADWGVFFAGVTAGLMSGIVQNAVQIVLAPIDIAKGIYVLIGKHWDPKLSEKYDGFTGALKAVWSHPLVFANKMLNNARIELEAELYKRHYHKAGYRFGKIAPDVFFLLSPLKGIGSVGRLGVALVRAIPRVTLSTIRELRLLPELVRFFLSTQTRAVIDGTVLERAENAIIVMRKEARAVRVELESLSAEERAMWNRAVREGQAGPLPTESPTGPPPPRPVEPAAPAKQLPVRGVSDEARMAGAKQRRPSTAKNARDAQEFIDPAKGRIGLQRHNRAGVVREELGLSGEQVESAHLVAQAIGKRLRAKGFPYSPGAATTALLAKDLHSAFDSGWVPIWEEMKQTSLRTSQPIRAAQVRQMFDDAIRGIDPHLATAETKGTMGRLVFEELYVEIGVRPDTIVFP